MVGLSRSPVASRPVERLVRSRLIIRPLSFTFLACNPGEDIGGLPPLPLPDEVATANEGLDSGLVPGETLPSEGGVIMLGGGVREEALGVTGESAVVEGGGVAAGIGDAGAGTGEAKASISKWPTFGEGMSTGAGGAARAESVLVAWVTSDWS
jgi:hypothetical protein